MMYGRHSVVVLKLWLKHGLGRLQPTRDLASIVSEHMESPGTKAYTVPELRRMFRRFASVRLERIVTPYDRSRLPRPLARVLPSRFGWFIAIVARRRP
jgi:hypothetical protein